MSEQQLFRQYETIIGVDEAGRGCLAGPVSIGAISCSREQFRILSELDGLTDSKKLTPLKREKLYQSITSSGIKYQWITVDSNTIDRINILQATLQGMSRAVSGFGSMPQGQTLVAIDGNQKILTSYPQLPVVKGDLKFKTIAAASIIAKVSRDRLMEQFHLQFPQYRFDKHKGYPSKVHRDMIRLHGPCDIHRKSFKLI